MRTRRPPMRRLTDPTPRRLRNSRKRFGRSRANFARRGRRSSLTGAPTRRPSPLRSSRPTEMYKALSDFALRWARVPPQPDPPIGAPGSVRIFRAGKNYYFLRLLGWGIGQIGAVIGLLFSIMFVAAMDRAFQQAVLIRALPRTTQTNATP